MLQDGKIEDGKIEMKHREQYFFRFLKRGSIFLLVFCLVGCGASGSDRSAERKAEEQKTEVQLEVQGTVDIPNYYHKGNNKYIMKSNIRNSIKRINDELEEAANEFHKLFINENDKVL